MNGVTLLNEIMNGNIDNCKIKWKDKVSGESGMLEIEDRQIVWEPGTFNTAMLSDRNKIFYKVGLDKISIHNIEETDHVEIKEKINEIIDLVNKYEEEK